MPDFIHPKDRIPEGEIFPRHLLLQKAKNRARKASDEGSNTAAAEWWGYSVGLESYITDLEMFIEKLVENHEL